jgi:hypothetical protein
MGKGRGFFYWFGKVSWASRRFRVSSALPVPWNRHMHRPPHWPMIIPVLRVEVHWGEIVVAASDADYIVTNHKRILSARRRTGNWVARVVSQLTPPMTPKER